MRRILRHAKENPMAEIGSIIITILLAMKNGCWRKIDKGEAACEANGHRQFQLLGGIREKAILILDHESNGSRSYSMLGRDVRRQPRCHSANFSALRSIATFARQALPNFSSCSSAQSPTTLSVRKVDKMALPSTDLGFGSSMTQVTQHGKSAKPSGLEDAFHKLMAGFDEILLDSTLVGKSIAAAIQLDEMLFRLKLWKNDIGEADKVFSKVELESPKLKEVTENIFSRINEGLTEMKGILTTPESSEK